jgi:hypothetical protein
MLINKLILLIILSSSINCLASQDQKNDSSEPEKVIVTILFGNTVSNLQRFDIPFSKDATIKDLKQHWIKENTEFLSRRGLAALEVDLQSVTLCGYWKIQKGIPTYARKKVNENFKLSDLKKSNFIYFINP